MKSNFLARIFEWNREVIEAAETPFAKLAIFILPILSPIVPASMTGLHIFKLMQIIFDFGEVQDKVSWAMAVIVGVVLELIGYVGVVAFIQAIYRWIKFRRIEYLVPAVLNGFAYLFYLVSMFAINYQLGKYFNTPNIVNNIVGLLSFITVPTGLLAANHLSENADSEEKARDKKDNQEFQLKKTAIKQGFNIFSPGDQKIQRSGAYTEKPASHYKEKMIGILESEFVKSGKVLEPRDITDQLKTKHKVILNHERAKGFISKTTTDWCKEKGIVRSKNEPGK